MPYGYLPYVEDIGDLGDISYFERGLVLGGEAGFVYENFPEARAMPSEGVELPDGVFWFSGGGGLPLIVQVRNIAVPPMSATTASLDDFRDNPDHPLRTAKEWAEHYWQAAEQIPTPQFAIGASVQHAQRGNDLVVLAREFSHPHWRYTFNIDGSKKELLENNVVPIPELGDPLTWVNGSKSDAHQFGATLSRAKLLGRFANTIYSFRATRTLFRAYQFKPILKLLQTGKSRILIADEVGLGKTIEAGLIWTELEARHEADRVLVVCPAGLVTKWKSEMEERFGFEVRELDRNAMIEFSEKHELSRLPERFAYVTSIERIRGWEGLATLKKYPISIDLLIMDEAHSMRNTSTRNHAAGAVLAQLARAAIFLTATPINLHKRDIFSLTGLLAPEDELDERTAMEQLEPNRFLNRVAAILGKPNPDLVEVRQLLVDVKEVTYGRLLARRPEFNSLVKLLAPESVSPAEIVEARRYIATLNALASVISRTRKAEVDEEKPLREARRVDVSWTPEENAFYDEYLEWCRARAQKLGSALLFSMQMPLRLASASLAVARNAVIAGTSNPEALRDEDSPKKATTSDTYRDLPPKLLAAANALDSSVDSKFDRLIPVLRELKKTKKRAILFTFSKPTLGYLERRLRDEFRIAVLNGDVLHAKRHEVLKTFRAGGFDFVLANRVASEGLDFEFCSAVINYDLPWNPMEVEQRIGRIDRIGQKEKKILIVNFINERTIDDQIMIRLLDRIKIFEDTIGELEPIVHGEMKQLWKEIDFDFTPEQLDQKMQQVRIAVEEQREMLRDVQTQASSLFVADDVDIKGLEEELVSSGRYVGPIEIANLIRDWAATDGGRTSLEEESLTLTGNPAMADRVVELSRLKKRTRSETELVATQLRQELPLPLALDQELARTSGIPLLNANHPLTMAAVSVPTHRQSRFAHVQVNAEDSGLSPGHYAVLIAIAKNASRGGDELWGDAFRIDDYQHAPGAFDLLMSRLANGQLHDAHVEHDSGALIRAVKRMKSQIGERHSREQMRLDAERQMFRDSRALALKNQYEARVVNINSKISTMRSRNVEEQVLRMFAGQIAAADQAYAINLRKMEEQASQEIEIEYLAVCVMGVNDEQRSQ
jgi:superfamily II DNA or RNA helicase